MNPNRRVLMKRAAIAGAIAGIHPCGVPRAGLLRRTERNRHAGLATRSEFRPTHSGSSGASQSGFPRASTRRPQWASTAWKSSSSRCRTNPTPALQKLKRQAHSLGLALMGFSTHQGFVSPDPAIRQANIQKTLDQIEIAYRLGIPTMRINTGRWGTIASFDDLMTKKGIEPPLSGHTEDEAFKWVIDSIEKLLPKAEECGVVLGLENHWGLGRTAEGVLRIVEAIQSPWLGMTLDTGNFSGTTLRADAEDDGVEGADCIGAGQDLLRRRTVVHTWNLITDGSRECCGIMAIRAGSPWSSREVTTRRRPYPPAWPC